MRKYAIAGAAAATAFAVSAFAATLNADAGTLQVGTDPLEELAQTADVQYLTHVDGQGERYLDKVIVKFDKAVTGFVNINGLKQGQGNPYKTAWGGGKAIDGADTVTFNVPTNTYDAKDLLGVSVELKDEAAGAEVGGWGIGQ